VPILSFFVFVFLVVLVTLALGYGLSSVEERAVSRRLAGCSARCTAGGTSEGREFGAGYRSLAKRGLKYPPFEEQFLLARMFSLSIYGVYTYM
jgi:hypothetical protein